MKNRILKDKKKGAWALSCFASCQLAQEAWALSKYCKASPCTKQEKLQHTVAVFSVKSNKTLMIYCLELLYYIYLALWKQ